MPMKCSRKCSELPDVISDSHRLSHVVYHKDQSAHQCRSHMGAHYHMRNLQTAMWLEFSPEEGSIGQYESPGRRVARREERMKKGVERRERGSVTSSARGAIDLWDKRGISHRPVCLCNRKLFGVKVGRLQTCDSGEMTQLLPSSTTKPDHRA